MSRYVTTQSGFYCDRDTQAMGRDAAWLYRYLYENDHVHGVTGIGMIAEPIIMAEAMMTPEQFADARSRLDGKVRWFASGHYWVTARAKHTMYRDGGDENPKMVASARNHIRKMPDEVRLAFLARYPIDTLPHAPPIPHQPLPDLTGSAETKAETETKAEAETDKDMSPAAPAQAAAVAPALFSFEWNRMAAPAKLPVVHTMTEKRRVALRQRTRDGTWVERWTEALGMIPKCPFLCGQNDRGWTANADWFLRPGVVTKILEGQYSGTARKHGGVSRRFDSAPDGREKYAALDGAVPG